MVLNVATYFFFNVFLFNVRKRQLKATANQLLWQQEINNKQQTEEKTPKVPLNQKKPSKK